MQAKKEAYCDAINMLKVFSEASGIAFKDCLEKAWDEIKDRKGKMINGMFVKESDLPDNRRCVRQTSERIARGIRFPCQT